MRSVVQIHPCPPFWWRLAAKMKSSRKVAFGYTALRSEIRASTIFPHYVCVLRFTFHFDAYALTKTRPLVFCLCKSPRFTFRFDDYTPTYRTQNLSACCMVLHASLSALTPIRSPKCLFIKKVSKVTQLSLCLCNMGNRDWLYSLCSHNSKRNLIDELRQGKDTV